MEFFSTRTAYAKKFIFVLLLSKCNYLQLLKKLALYNKFLSRKKYFSDARGQNDPPLGSTRVKIWFVALKFGEMNKQSSSKIPWSNQRFNFIIYFQFRNICGPTKTNIKHDVPAENYQTNNNISFLIVKGYYL